MKKKCVFLCVVLVLLLTAPLCTVQAETPHSYQEIIDEIISTHGKFGDYANSYATGLIYGELIDFDNNGTDEMLLVYKKRNDSSQTPPWANILVYGMQGNRPVKLLDEGAYGHLGQTDVSYEILFKNVGGKTFLLLNGEPTPIENGDSEKVIVFTVEKNKAVLKTYYGEVSPWWDEFEFKYTKCLIDNKAVSEEVYTEELAGYYRDAKRLLLFPGKDFENHSFCNREKLDSFLREVENINLSPATFSDKFKDAFSGIRALPTIVFGTFAIIMLFFR